MRKLAIAGLVAAPLVALAGRALMPPQYQNDQDLLDTSRYLQALADAGTRADTGALLAALSAALLVGTALALAWIADRRLGWIGAALSVVGSFGVFAIAVFALIAGRLAEEPDRAAAISTLDRIYNAPVFSVFVLALALGAIGSVLLAIALYRGRRVPRAAAVVVGLGGVCLMLTAPGPLLAYVVGAAVVAVAGSVWMALSVPRSPQPVPR